jgi:hypothetical protein
MAYGDHVPESVWDDRYSWIRATEDQEAGEWGSILLSRHATLLSYDIETAFCAGAWVSVIVLAHAAIDATIRDIETGDYKSNSQKLFGDDQELQWLRTVRNRLVHVSPADSSKALPQEAEDDVAYYHESLEPQARRALRLLYRWIYASPGT